MTSQIGKSEIVSIIALTKQLEEATFWLEQNEKVLQATRESIAKDYVSKTLIAQEIEALRKAFFDNGVLDSDTAYSDAITAIDLFEGNLLGDEVVGEA